MIYTGQPIPQERSRPTMETDEYISQHRTMLHHRWRLPSVVERVQKLLRERLDKYDVA
jgi:hypothetical protein